MNIDYLDILGNVKITKEQDKAIKEHWNAIRDICRKRKLKILIVDSLTRELKEI